MKDAERFTRDDLAELVGARLAAIWHEPLLAAFRSYGITTALRQAHFLAQILHESGGLRWLEEIWGPTPAQERYEGRRDLGNVQDGDGYRYRGRGLIQLTGRANYRRYGELLGLPLEANPDLAAQPEHAAMIAGAYWDRRGLNSRADRDDLEAVTRGVNGGLNGLEDRRRWLERAKRALGVGPQRPSAPRQ